MGWRKSYVEILKDRHHEIGAEVGVLEGKNVVELLKTLPDLKLMYCVDPWEDYKEFRWNRKRPMSEIKKDYEKNIEPYKNRVKTMHMYSEDAANKVKNASLDFIFIDANHAYEYVKQDILLWSPKVKKGGVISGHDYVANPNEFRYGVKLAVDEFFPEVSLLGGTVWWAVNKC